MTTSTAYVPRARSLARGLARRLRKPAKRALSYIRLGALRMSNLISRDTVLGTVPAVVSLTTYGRRIGAAAVAVESIARGLDRPSRLILWLDDPELFDHRPAALRRLERRGLEVRLTRNLGPHTKYYPYVESVAEHVLPLVTADDDIMYPKTWLRDLYRGYQEFPASVNCHWAHLVPVLRSSGDAVAGYLSWPHCTDTAPGPDRYALGVSGVIYPPRMLDELARRGERFVTASPSADDVWLHWVALRAGISVRQIAPKPRHFPLIPGTQEQSLMQSNNIAGSGNDQWIRGLYTAHDIAALRPGRSAPAPLTAETTGHAPHAG